MKRDKTSVDIYHISFSSKDNVASIVSSEMLVKNTHKNYNGKFHFPLNKNSSMQTEH